MTPKPEKCTKSTRNAQNGNDISQMSVEYSKRTQNISTFSNLRPSKIYPNCTFWFENKPSGKPVLHQKSQKSSKAEIDCKAAIPHLM
jgi:hypothetical protein